MLPTFAGELLAFSGDIEPFQQRRLHHNLRDDKYSGNEAYRDTLRQSFGCQRCSWQPVPRIWLIGRPEKPKIRGTCLSWALAKTSKRAVFWPNSVDSW